MTTGLEDEETTYVESNPAENFDSLRLKNRELHLDEKKKQELLALAPGDEKADLTPKVGKRTLKKTQRAEREKTKGDNWFGMKAPEVTEETRRELEVLQMRSALDPKRFYKKNDLKVLPKYFQVRKQVFKCQTQFFKRTYFFYLFQIGRVIDNPVDYYTDRTTKKDKKKSLVDELMADAEFKKYNKRKYTEIIEEKAKHQRRFQAKGSKKRKAN